MACPVLADIEEKQDRWDGDATFENLQQVFRFHIENSTLIWWFVVYEEG